MKIKKKYFSFLEKHLCIIS